MGGTRPRYAQNSGAVFSLKYHVVWCPKYRRQVLVPPVDTRLKTIIATVAADHVHLFIAADPTRAVAEIVNRFNGRTSRLLRDEFKSLRSRLPTLWSRSYFAATVGAVSEATIRRSIEAQKGV